MEIKAVIDTVLSGFNNKDFVLYNNAFSIDAVFMDGTVAYRWKVLMRGPFLVLRRREVRSTTLFVLRVHSLAVKKSLDRMLECLSLLH